MLDLRYLRENPDAIRAALRLRHQEGLLPEVDRLLQLDEEWRAMIVERDRLRSEQNTVSKEIGRLKREKKDARAIIARMQEVAAQVRELDRRVQEVRADMDAVLYSLPNVPHESTPEGTGAEDNPVLHRWGDLPTFDFPPKNHWELGEALDVLDLARGSKIAGSGFPLYKGQGARLQRALIQMMLDIHTTEHGYTEIWPPFLANRATMTGTSQLPKFEDDMYRLARQGIETEDPEGLREPHPNDLFLIPTAEVPVTNIHAGEILDGAQLPLCYTAYTPCFRREAGAAGRETRGILRLHQFEKVELVKLTRPEASYDEHESLLANAETILQRLEVPYRVVQLCGGDLGFAAAKCYDIEVWAAAQEQWLEVSSVSNFEEFQARRANIRYRPEPDAKPEFVHTLNGSGVALPRLVVALMENNQQSDGRIRVPDALRPYLGAAWIG